VSLYCNVTPPLPRRTIPHQEPATDISLCTCIHRAVAAFVAPQTAQTSTALNAARREFLSAAAAAAAGLATFAPAANAIRDYEGIGYLGGGKIIDVNNANVRAYLKLPGMYPSAAGKIASNGPYKSVSEIYSIPGLTSAEKDVMKKYESRFTALAPSADYVIDRINNGLYR
jgi:photosystem II PsbU protein